MDLLKNKHRYSLFNYVEFVRTRIQYSYPLSRLSDEQFGRICQKTHPSVTAASVARLISHFSFQIINSIIN